MAQLEACCDGVFNVAEGCAAGLVERDHSLESISFEGGVDLSEVQRAYNVLEEVIWWRILKHLPAEQQGEALGLVGTVLGSGKDTLARKYVSLATQTHTPSLDLKALFSGTDG